MSFAPGSLVRARGREWVVLPDSEADFLMLRPLGGTDDEVTGICADLEPIQSATFDLPDPSRVGDHRSCNLLRDAVRLSSRAGAGPFRSLARIGVEPRPYQLVPLLMALRLDPVRLLIADDVGTGKSLEAMLIARELIDRGEVKRLAVLCPPHLAEQWQAEIRTKFHIDAEAVLPSTANRLERACRVGQSLFDLYPFVVVSMDFIKSDRRRDEFVRTCPELVIVDEAHTCAFGEERGGRHQRHELLKRLADDPRRHLILVTATPHSGKEGAFRSLLTFMDPTFAKLPDDLSGPRHEADRRRVAAHLVQRRRGDLRHYLDADTPFPERTSEEHTYTLTPEYRKLFNRVLEYARETVKDTTGGQHRQRVRWWSALALLRSLASSPSAAAATLRNRAPAADTDSVEAADDIGRRTVLDLDIDESAESMDVPAGADSSDEVGPQRQRLLDMARQAEKLKGDGDAKLLGIVRHLTRLVSEDYRPIVFCRFIPTAEYLASELGKRLRGVEVIAVTGALPPSDREKRVLDLSKAPRRVLIATDCLSEGINLQEHFDAVIHYDLSWNPTRHEQRAGRVDRYGQARDTVRVLTYYGADNTIDALVLDVLLRKHSTIRSSLGVSVPVPGDSGKLIETIAEGVLLSKDTGDQALLPGMEEHVQPHRQALHAEWDAVAEREKRSRTMYAQESIKPEEVAPELAAAKTAIGGTEAVERFTLTALRAQRAVITTQSDRYRFDLSEVPRSLRDVLATPDQFEGQFSLPVPEGVEHVSRTHPLVEGLAAYVMDTALDAHAEGVARRAGAIRTSTVKRRTTVLLVRFRFDLVTRRGDAEHPEIAEECRVLAFGGAPESAEWLDERTTEVLVQATPDANINPDQASTFIRRVVEGYEHLRPRIEKEATDRAAALLEAHRRVRSAARIRGVSYRVNPQLPPDVLGIYVYLPATGD